MEVRRGEARRAGSTRVGERGRDSHRRIIELESWAFYTRVSMTVCAVDAWGAPAQNVSVRRTYSWKMPSSVTHKNKRGPAILWDDQPEIPGCRHRHLRR